VNKNETNAKGNFFTSMYFSCLFRQNAFFMNGFQSFLLTLLLVSSYHKDSQKHAELQAHSMTVISSG